MSKIIRGYWSCQSCGTQDIDGLMDVCPYCGARKPSDIRYYMKDPDDVVTTQQLEEAGIGADECDGEHKEWVCAYCGYLNNFSNTDCASCGAPKEESQQNYGEEPETVSEPEMAMQDPVLVERKSRNTGKIFKYILLGLLAFWVILLFPYKSKWTVTGFTWEREITVEQMEIRKENDWTVPEGAVVYDTKQEIRTYVQQVSHYETVTVTRSREVVDYYETEYEYIDNGNGTFSEISYEVPVYTTEYYEVEEQQPVYIAVPVYDTMYYYEREHWSDLETYLTSGTDKGVYWSREYVMTRDQRDEKRRESYFVIYDKGESEELTFEEWDHYELGDVYSVKTCLLGVIYSQEKITKGGK